MKNFLVKLYEDHRCCVFLVAIILALALIFGIMCANTAILMVCWNFAVVAAITVCVPIGFWQAFVLDLAVSFLIGKRFLNIVAAKKSDDD